MRTSDLSIFVVVAASLVAGRSAGTGQPMQTSDDFLNRLVGSWTLTGTMGSTELRQKVDANWVVQDGESGQWKMVLRQREQSGEWKVLATKVLSGG